MSQSLRQRLGRAVRLRRAIRLVWQAAPGWTLLNLAMVALQGLLPLAALLLLRQIVDALALAVSSVQPQLAPVLWWVFLAGLVALTTTLVNLLGGLAGKAQGLAVADYVADLIHEQSIAVKLAYYEDAAFHDTLQQAQMEAPYRPVQVVNNLKQLLQSGLLLCGIGGLLFVSHWAVGLALLAAVAPAALLHVRHARAHFDLEREQVGEDRRGQYYHWLLSGAEWAATLRLLGIGRLLSERYSTLNRGLRLRRLELLRRQTRGDMLAQGVATLALYGTLAAMVFYAVAGSLSLGVIVMYFQGYQRALGALQGLLQGLAGLYEDNLFLAHFDAFMALPTSLERGGSEEIPEAGEQGLVCRDLYFSYPGHGDAVLAGVDLTIGPGEVVALVGANGAGKTTLAKLLCRLYEPERGSICWEGEELKTLNPCAWRRRISVVSQEVPQFDLSAAENVWLGDIEQPPLKESIRAAAAKAGCGELLDSLPQGLETLLGTQFEGGRELSIGEWQRLALARAWFRDADLVILDEPSSALDPLAEAGLIDSFSAIAGQRGVLIISHRLSTARLADRICMMVRGRIVEQGSHDELMHRDGAYARFFLAQAGHYRS